ncbi:uncharacterized protein LOC125028935 [Penaeus chinensis]|uniref:uncharacterized protein LOC125028935 n=1 Tax=Penaeus chinensis TaxID=139456 RepID=UPI001FB75444|nr:uncharacterized protein LOC125028935 [Penaeus chinensis]
MASKIQKRLQLSAAVIAFVLAREAVCFSVGARHSPSDTPDVKSADAFQSAEKETPENAHDAGTTYSPFVDDSWTTEPVSDGGEGPLEVDVNKQTTVYLTDAEVNYQTTGSPVGANTDANYQTIYPIDSDTEVNYQTTSHSLGVDDGPPTESYVGIGDPTKYIEPVEPTDVNRALEIDEDQIRNIIRVNLEKKANGGENGGHFSHRVLELDEEEIRNSIRERVQEANDMDENILSSFTSGKRKEEGGGGQVTDASMTETYDHGEVDQKFFLSDGNADVLMESGWIEEESNGGEVMDEELETEVTTEPDMAGGGEVDDNNAEGWTATRGKGGGENENNKLDTDGEPSLEEGFDSSLEDEKGEIDDVKREEKAEETINTQTIGERIMALEEEADEIEQFDPEKVEANLKRLEGHFRELRKKSSFEGRSDEGQAGLSSQSLWEYLLSYVTADDQEKPSKTLIVEKRLAHPCDMLKSNFHAWKRHATRVNVVVVGGGVAGLAALRTLTSMGVEDVLLLEATNRLGGRIHTVRHDKWMMEEGISVIQGDRDNPVFDVAKELGLLGEPVAEPDWESDVVTSDGDKMPLANVLKGASILQQLRQDEREEHRFRMYRDRPLGEFYLDRFEELWGSSDNEKDKQAWMYYTHQVVSQEHGGHWMNMSSLDAKNFVPLGYEYTWRGGMDGFVRYLMGAIAQPQIRPNAPVCQVFWDQPDGGGALVVTADGSSFLADYLVVALPLAVLKERHLTTFIPPLPRQLTSAFSAFEAGTVNRVALSWPSPWWLEGDLERQIMWREYSFPPEMEWMSSIVQVKSAPHNRAQLEMLVTGEASLTMEEMPVETVISHLMTLIRAINRPYTVPLPSFFHRSQWNKNPWARSSYQSYMTMDGVKRRLKDRSVLCPRLASSSGRKSVFFAGEHTSTDRFGTVDGSFLSGIRAAKWVMDEVVAQRLKPYESEEVKFTVPDAQKQNINFFDLFLNPKKYYQVASVKSKSKESEELMSRRRNQPDRRNQDGRPTLYYGQSRDEAEVVPRGQFGDDRQQETYIIQTEDGRRIPVVFSRKNGGQMPLVLTDNNGDQVPVVLSGNNGNQVVLSGNNGDQVPIVLEREDGQQVAYVIAEDNGQQTPYVIPTGNSAQVQYVMSSTNRPDGQQKVYIMADDNNHHVPLVVSPDNEKQAPYIATTGDGHQVSYVLSTKNGQQVPFVLSNGNNHEGPHDQSSHRLPYPLAVENGPKVTFVMAAKDSRTASHDSSREKSQLEILRNVKSSEMTTKFTPALAQSEDESSSPLSKEEFAIVYVDSEGKRISDIPMKLSSMVEGMVRESMETSLKENNQENATPLSTVEEEGSQDEDRLSIQDSSFEDVSISGRLRNRNRKRNRNKGIRNRNRNRKRDKPSSQEDENTSHSDKGEAQTQHTPPQHITYNSPLHFPLPLPSHYFPYVGSSTPTTESTTAEPAKITSTVPNAQVTYYANNRMSVIMEPDLSQAHDMYDFQGSQSYPQYAVSVNAPSLEMPSYPSSHSQPPLKLTTNFYHRSPEAQTPPTVWQRPNVNSPPHSQGHISGLDISRQASLHLADHLPHGDSSYNGAANNPRWTQTYNQHPRYDMFSSTTEPYYNVISSTRQSLHMPPIHQPENPTPFDVTQTLSTQIKNLQQSQYYSPSTHPFTDPNYNRGSTANKAPSGPYGAYPHRTPNKGPVGPYDTYPSTSTNSAPSHSYASYPVSSHHSQDYDSFPPNRQALLEYYNIRPGPNGQVHMNINMPPLLNRDQSSVYAILDDGTDPKTLMTANRHRSQNNNKSRMQDRMGSYEYVDSAEFLGSPYDVNQTINFERVLSPNSKSTSGQQQQQHTSTAYETGSRKEFQGNSDEFVNIKINSEEVPINSEEFKSKEVKANSTTVKNNSKEKTKYEVSKLSSEEIKRKSEEMEAKISSEININSGEFESKLSSNANSEELTVNSEDSEMDPGQHYSVQVRDGSSGEDSSNKEETEKYYSNNGMPVHPGFLSAISAMQYTPVILQPMSFFNPMMQSMNPFPPTRTDLSSPHFQSQSAQKRPQRPQSSEKEEVRSFSLHKLLVQPEKKLQDSIDSQDQLETINTSLDEEQASADIQSMEEFLYEISLEISSGMKNNTGSGEQKRARKNKRKRNRGESDRDLSIEILTEALQSPKTEQIMKSDVFTIQRSENQERIASTPENHEVSTVQTTAAPDLHDHTSDYENYELYTTEMSIFNTWMPESDSSVQDNEETSESWFSWYMNY